MKYVLSLKKLVVALGLVALVSTSSARAEDYSSDSIRPVVVQWVSEHCKMSSPEANRKLGSNLGDMIDSQTDFVATFSGEVMNSGYAYQAIAFANHFFVCRLSDVQAKNIMPGGGPIVILSGKQSYEVKPAVIELSQLAIKNCDKLDPTKPIEGEVRFKRVGSVPSALRIRLSYRWGIHYTEAIKSLNEEMVAAEGIVTFTLPPMRKSTDKADDAPGAGPQTVFVDLCTVADKNGDTNSFLKSISSVCVYSNPVPAMLDIKASVKSVRTSATPSVTPTTAPVGIAEAAGVVTLVGTKWQFPGTKSTVEFLAGGKLRWNDDDTDGTWKRDGNSIEINVNDYTLFHFTLDGNTMQGYWERLKGSEKGMTLDSSLTRIVE